VIVKTTDGVEVEVRWMGVLGPCMARCNPADPALRGDWRETAHPTVEAAAKWVQRLTWVQVREGCL